MARASEYGSLRGCRDRRSASRWCAWGMHAEDAASALLRIAHMVNLYRSRRMFGLGSAEAYVGLAGWSPCNGCCSPTRGPRT